MLGSLFFAIFLIIANGFFVAAEFALVKVRSTQLEVLAERGDRLAILARNILRNLNAYLSAAQLGITLSSLGLGWVGERGHPQARKCRRVIVRCEHGSWAVDDDEARHPLGNRRGELHGDEAAVGNAGHIQRNEPLLVQHRPQRADLQVQGKIPFGRATSSKPNEIRNEKAVVFGEVELRTPPPQRVTAEPVHQ